MQELKKGDRPGLERRMGSGPQDCPGGPKSARPNWIHAVLHKMEGDVGNSKYWYARAEELERFPWSRTRNYG